MNEKEGTRKSFVFYETWWDSISNLPDEYQKEICAIIIKYGLYGDDSEEASPIARAIFMLIKPQMDLNRKKYEAGCIGADHGKKGGRPPGPQENPSETPKKPQENPSETPRKPQRNPSETPKKPQENPYNVICNNVECNNDNNVATYSREWFKSVFFAKPITLEGYLKRWEISQKELEDICNEVLDEWDSVGQTHKDELDAKRHFRDSVRKKISYIKTKQNETRGESKTDRFPERRGTEPATKDRRGFKGTFQH